MKIFIGVKILQKESMTNQAAEQGHCVAETKTQSFELQKSSNVERVKKTQKNRKGETKFCNSRDLPSACHFLYLEEQNS